MSIQKMLEYLVQLIKGKDIDRSLDFRMNSLILVRVALKLRKGRVVGTAGVKYEIRSQTPRSFLEQNHNNTTEETKFLPSSF